MQMGVPRDGGGRLRKRNAADGSVLPTYISSEIKCSIGFVACLPMNPTKPPDTLIN